MASDFSGLIDGIKLQASNLVEQIRTDPKIASLRKLQVALNSLEDLAGYPRTSMGMLLQFENDTDETSGSNSAGAPDEFYGLEPLEAAKRFLHKVGPVRKSADFNEIVRAIRAGGGDPGNEDKLRVSLARSTVEVAKVGDDRFGLLEFYPHVKRGTPGRKKKGETEVTPSIDAVVAEAPTGKDADADNGSQPPQTTES